MSSTQQPDTGIPAPAPHEAPLSATEAARLLDSIRQAEAELAETGEQIAVTPAETATPATDSAAAADAQTAQPKSEVSGTEADAAEIAAAAADSAPAGAADSADADVVDERVESSATAESEVVAAAVDADADGVADAADVDPGAEDVAAETIVAAAEEAGEESAVEAAGTDREAAEAAAAGREAGESVLTASGFTLPGDVADDVETIVHVMRHGEVHNPKGILYGRLPGFQLSVTGRAQAQAVARSLADHDVALVVASPLQRAQETAEPVAAQHGAIIRTDENLIEAGNIFEGLRVAVGDGALRQPRHWWKLRDPFTPSWGEPYLQIAHRMLAAVNKARVEAAGREAVLVSHQLPVWTLRRFLQGQRLWHDPRNRQCSLASLTSLVYQGDTLIDIVYSEPAGTSDPKVFGA